MFAATEAWKNVHDSSQGAWVPLFPFTNEEFVTFVTYFVRQPGYSVFNYAWQLVTVANDPGEWEGHGVHIVRHPQARGTLSVHVQTTGVQHANKRPVGRTTSGMQQPDISSAASSPLLLVPCSAYVQPKTGGFVAT